MYDRNITIVVGPGTDIWKQAMSNLPSPFPELAETISIPTSHDEYIDNQKKLLLEKESDYWLATFPRFLRHPLLIIFCCRKHVFD